MQRRIVDQARPWEKFSDTELRDLMFGATITRSHHVWSAGYCPKCGKPVPMYDWEIDAIERPWKVRCPRCRELFPKNDFYRFYRSGLDEQGVFDPKRADRSLLFNADHPGAADPLRNFGVDDGEGYVEGGHRWHFIGAYLLWGQWAQLVLDGIARSSAAYAVTGDAAYAHRAGILLDRVADLWPTFDFGAQGLVYERARYGGGTAGYVSYSIDSAYDARKLALAYDQIFEALPGDARRKRIEDRILRDVLKHPEKIRTNYPGREGTLAMIKTVLEWPRNRAEVMAAIDGIVAESTAVDGVSGEKGLNGYAAIAPRFLADFLEHYLRAEPGLLSGLLERHPKLRDTYRFFVDTWFARQYYPHIGDTGTVGTRDTQYAGVLFHRGEAAGKMETNPRVSPYTYLWRFYKATGDPVYLQILRQGNGGGVEGLPYDIYAEDPEAIVADVERVVAREGAWPKLASVNKREWRLAMLRSAANPDAGAVWLDYDSVPNCKLKGHYHYDAMNLGLYAKGLDLLPEFGYPAVQFGDWHTPQALWHGMTAAHNTVVVDGKNQAGGESATTLWADGKRFRAIRASSPDQYRGGVYERTVAMVNTGPSDFYVFDVFRVAGGNDHAKFTHGYFGALSTGGLSLKPAPEYGHSTLMRDFRMDPHPSPGWSVDWKVEDKYGYLPAGSDVHLRYTDLTTGGRAYTLESWTVRSPTSTEEFWIPTVMTRREGPASTFVSVLEPYEKARILGNIRRLALPDDGDAAVEIELADGGKDVVAAMGGELTFFRRDGTGKVVAIAACHAPMVSAGDVTVRFNRVTDFVELEIANGRVSVVSGNPGDIAEVRIGGRPARYASQRSSQP